MSLLSSTSVPDLPCPICLPVAKVSPVWEHVPQANVKATPELVVSQNIDQRFFIQGTKKFKEWLLESYTEEPKGGKRRRAC